MIAIRKAELSDAKRLVEIYDYSVKNQKRCHNHGQITPRRL
jgi:hypothetical protein